MKAMATVYVQGLDRMVKFYSECLRLKQAERDGDEFAVLESPEWSVALVTMPESFARQNPLHDPPGRRVDVPVKLGFSVGSIESVRRTFEECGGTVDDRSTEWEFQGVRRCDAVDPEGNVIQLLQTAG